MEDKETKIKDIANKTKNIETKFSEAKIIVDEAINKNQMIHLTGSYGIGKSLLIKSIMGDGINFQIIDADLDDEKSIEFFENIHRKKPIIGQKEIENSKKNSINKINYKKLWWIIIGLNISLYGVVFSDIFNAYSNSILFLWISLLVFVPIIFYTIWLFSYWLFTIDKRLKIKSKTKSKWVIVVENLDRISWKNFITLNNKLNNISKNIPVIVTYDHENIKEKFLLHHGNDFHEFDCISEYEKFIDEEVNLNFYVDDKRADILKDIFCKQNILDQLQIRELMPQIYRSTIKINNFRAISKGIDELKNSIIYLKAFDLNPLISLYLHIIRHLNPRLFTKLTNDSNKIISIINSKKSTKYESIEDYISSTKKEIRMSNGVELLLKNMFESYIYSPSLSGNSKNYHNITLGIFYELPNLKLYTSLSSLSKELMNKMKLPSESKFVLSNTSISDYAKSSWLMKNKKGVFQHINTNVMEKIFEILSSNSLRPSEIDDEINNWIVESTIISKSHFIWQIHSLLTHLREELLQDFFPIRKNHPTYAAFLFLKNLHEQKVLIKDLLKSSNLEKDEVIKIIGWIIKAIKNIDFEMSNNNQYSNLDIEIKSFYRELYYVLPFINENLRKEFIDSHIKKIKEQQNLILEDSFIYFFSKEDWDEFSKEHKDLYFQNEFAEKINLEDVSWSKKDGGLYLKEIKNINSIASDNFYKKWIKVNDDQLINSLLKNEH